MMEGTKMLVSFAVSNYRSFNQLEQFSMKAGKFRNFSQRIYRSKNTNVLKFKAVYGANASGKSNLVRAINFMQFAVLHGIPAEAATEYCRAHDENIGLPSHFEVGLLLNNVCYTYGFEALLNAGVFTREWLLEVKGTKTRTIFSRKVSDAEAMVTSYFKDSNLNERLQIYADDVISDGSILFLRIMNQNKDSFYDNYPTAQIYRMLYRWFQHKLSVNFPNEPITQYTYFFDSQGSANAEKLLAHFDTGILRVQINEEQPDKVLSQFLPSFRQDMLDGLMEQKRRIEERGEENTPAIMVRTLEGHAMYILELDGDDINCKTLKFNHRHGTSLFSLSEESDGTIRLLDLLEVLLSTTTNMVYMIDEVSRCMHPLLTKAFIRDFLALAIERDIQLIVTTHEADLLDLDLLRQDEIGFVERREADDSSRIFGLDQFGARFDKRIRGAYLEGAYGAIPMLASE